MMLLTSTLTAVREMTTIRRERLLPVPGEVVVSVGQEVSPVQVVARATRQKGFTIIPAAEILNVAPEEVPQYLLVEEGAAIQRKKPLLRKPGLFGSKRFTSPVNGVLQRVSNGRLILQQTPDLIELRALVHGVVTDLRGSRGVSVETHGAVIQAVWGSGREGYGKIVVVTETADAPLLMEHIGVDARGAILVAGRVEQIEVLEKAEENSVRGVIIGSVPATLAAVLPRFRFPLLVTDGFRGQSMASPIFELLHQLEGREASLFGHLLAGDNSRPEIIVPLEQREGEAEPAPELLHSLAAGRTVRVLCSPYAGQVGQVVAVHERRQNSVLGIPMAGADVALADGQVVFVPYPNLDLIT